VDRTYNAVKGQIDAMDGDVFEIGVFNPDAVQEPLMLPRVWDTTTLVRSISWLRLQNSQGRNVYIRPKGEHNLTLVDDLSSTAVVKMKRDGFAPALVVRTSPGNHQVWLKHPMRLDRELGTAVARSLAEQFGGDRGAADWRHFGRLAGFANRKSKYADPVTGLHPFVLLIEAKGYVYPKAEEFLAKVATEVKRRNDERELLRRRLHHAGATTKIGEKTINNFRSDARYAGDGNRIDLAYAIYAVCHGATTDDVAKAIRSRDLSHKGNERRQEDYVERTIKKALATIERQSMGLGR
jgi:hypothetical protein